jgi:hypothetical protein
VPQLYGGVINDPSKKNNYFPQPKEQPPFVLNNSELSKVIKLLLNYYPSNFLSSFMNSVILKSVTELNVYLRGRTFNTSP